jgi:hypothetical protein
MPFTASIIQRSFIYVPDKILKLGGASWMRTMPILTQPWSRIRIGLLCSVTPDSTNNISDALFTLGICSGTALPGANPNTLNYVGASLIGGSTAGAARLLTYTASANGPYYSTTAGYFYGKAEGTIYSTAAVFNPVVMLATTPAAGGLYPRRTLLVLDITKTVGNSGSVGMTLYGPSSTLVQTTDYRPDDLQYALDSLTTPTIRGQALTVLSSNSTVTWSPLIGDIDTVEVFWSNTQFPLEISAIGANVLAPPYYTNLGIANESFEEYGTTSGSIPESSFLSGGSGWSATGSVGYDTSTYAGVSGNTSNLAVQTYGGYVGTINVPDDPFEQYLIGTVASSVTISAGSYWASTGVINAQANSLAPQVYGQYVGTTTMPDDGFEQYLVGTINSGVTISLGTYWGAAATVIARATDT